jgi:hypothetical protein
MAIIYEYAATDGYIRFDFTNEEINCQDTIDELEVQELNNAIRAAEEDPIGMGFTQIATITGKISLSNSIFTGITVELLGTWVVFSEKSSGDFATLGGNLVRFDQTTPYKPNTNITNLLVQSANSTIVTTTSGAGFTAADRAVITATNTQQDAQLTEEAFKDLSFNKDNTVNSETGKIDSYSVNGGEVTVAVTYDADGIPIKEEAA